MVSMALEKLEKSPARLTLSIASGTVALGLAAVLGWATFERNAVWESEATLWSDVMARSPRNGRAFMNYGLTRLDHDPVEAFDYLRRAAVISAGDPVIEINLALAYGRLSQPVEAESQFRRATSDGPSYAPAYSAYGQWMLAQDRASEALQMASRALALDPYDLAGRRTLMDIMAQRHQWSNLAQFARETLRLFPDDPDGERSLLVAQTGLDQVDKAEEDVKTQPSVDGYLALSVLYFQSERYEDCINSAREVLKINPKQAEAYANLAAAYHSMGKLEDTILALREEVRLNPDLPSARSNLEIELTAKALQSEQHLKSGQ
jgi:tetratricopeptide (TPR) repeat protein